MADRIHCGIGDRTLDRLAFVQLSDSADGKQDDRLGPQASAPGYQRVTKFMDQDAGKDNSYQREIARFIGGTMRSVLCVPDKKREQEEGPVDAEFNSENAACRNGPVPHETCAHSTCSYSIYLDSRWEGRVAISPNKGK